MKSLEIVRKLPGYRYHGSAWHSMNHGPGYLLGVICFAVALLIRFAIDGVLPVGFPFITFLPAVVLVTFVGGVWPGAFTTLLSLLASWYHFVPPLNSFGMDQAAAMALAFFLLIASVDIMLMYIAFSAFKESAALAQSNKTMSDHQALLLRELDHRIKNLFAVVSSVIKMSVRDARTPQQLADDATARILAISRSHNSLLLVGAGAGLGAAEVARQTLNPYLDQHGSRIHLDIGSEPLDVQLVQVLGLVLHELATNSMKYGALGSEDGQVKLTAQTRGDSGEFLQLLWEETSTRLAAQQNHVGFGSQMIEKLMSAYGGDFQRDVGMGRLVALIKLPRVP